VVEIVGELEDAEEAAWKRAQSRHIKEQQEKVPPPPLPPASPRRLPLPPLLPLVFAHRLLPPTFTSRAQDGISNLSLKQIYAAKKTPFGVIPSCAHDMAAHSWRRAQGIAAQRRGEEAGPRRLVTKVRCRHRNPHLSP
jgi:hypothetical protein